MTTIAERAQTIGALLAEIEACRIEVEDGKRALKVREAQVRSHIEGRNTQEREDALTLTLAEDEAYRAAQKAVQSATHYRALAEGRVEVERYLIREQLFRIRPEEGATHVSGGPI